IRIFEFIPISSEHVYFKADIIESFSLHFYDKNKKWLTNVSIGDNRGTVDVPSTARYLKVRVTRYNGNLKPEDISSIRPMLNLGITAKPFVQRNPTYLYAETTLAGNDNKKDILSRNENLN